MANSIISCKTDNKNAVNNGSGGGISDSDVKIMKLRHPIHDPKIGGFGGTVKLANNNKTALYDRSKLERFSQRARCHRFSQTWNLAWYAGIQLAW